METKKDLGMVITNNYYDNDDLCEKFKKLREDVTDWGLLWGKEYEEFDCSVLFEYRFVIALMIEKLSNELKNK
jgi:hypothetical protein